jgi:GntR family transcriptional repressor for pyruvate dehydrogenase complex
VANTDLPARRAEKVSEVVARTIAHDIASRGLAPGTTLPSEAAMLERYQVGRASLREGLRILEINGLISVRPGPGGGPVVAAANSGDFGRMSTLHYQATGATFRDLLDARMIIEPLMARLAAQQGDPGLTTHLKDLSDLTKAGVESDRDYSYYSSEFHAAIASASGNRILNLFGRSLKDVYAARVSGAMFPLDERHHVIHDHDAIFKAIQSGNGTAAERLMRKHMERFAEFVSARLPGALDEVVDWR